MYICEGEGRETREIIHDVVQSSNCYRNKCETHCYRNKCETQSVTLSLY